MKMNPALVDPHDIKVMKEANTSRARLPKTPEHLQSGTDPEGVYSWLLSL
jgi:hypothetical protein